MEINQDAFHYLCIFPELVILQEVRIAVGIGGRPSSEKGGDLVEDALTPRTAGGSLLSLHVPGAAATDWATGI